MASDPYQQASMYGITFTLRVLTYHLRMPSPRPLCRLASRGHLSPLFYLLDVHATLVCLPASARGVSLADPLPSTFISALPTRCSTTFSSSSPLHCNSFILLRRRAS